jgi:hypothetical protein
MPALLDTSFEKERKFVAFVAEELVQRIHYHPLMQDNIRLSVSAILDKKGPAQPYKFVKPKKM